MEFREKNIAMFQSKHCDELMYARHEFILMGASP